MVCSAVGSWFGFLVSSWALWCIVSCVVIVILLRCYVSLGCLVGIAAYMLVQPSLCRCNCDADRCSYMSKSVILLFMGCAT